MTLINQFFNLLDRRPRTQVDKRCGFSENTVNKWRYRVYQPKLLNFQAALNSIGYDLIIVPLPTEQYQGKEKEHG